MIQEQRKDLDNSPGRDVYRHQECETARRQGYDHLMEAVDVAKKYVILVKATIETTKAAVETQMEIVSRFEPPERVVSDRGRASMSEAFMLTYRDLNGRCDPVGVGDAQATVWSKS